MPRSLRIIPAFAFFLLLLAWIAPASFAQSESTSATEPAIDRVAISTVMSDLTQGDTYKYPDTALEDSLIVQWIRAWLHRLNSPMQAGGFTVTARWVLMSVFLSLLVIALIVVLTLVIVRMVRMQSGIRMGLAGELGGMEGIPLGEWGELGGAKATELAGAGNLKAAISLLFQALLKGLDKTGWVRYQRGVASRTYLRQLRKSDQLYPLFRDFLWRFELAYYRELVPSQDDWHFLYTTYGKVAAAVHEIPAPSNMRKK
jgi:hypothetical protein